MRHTTQLPRLKQIAFLIHMLSEDLGVIPTIVRNLARTHLTVYFENTSLEVNQLFDNYCVFLLPISKQCTVFISGIVSGFEQGRIKITANGAFYNLGFYSSSGAEFEVIQELSVTFWLHDVAEVDLCQAILERCKISKEFVALNCVWQKNPYAAEILEPAGLFYYRYAYIGGTSKPDYSLLVDSLTVLQIKELWRMYLEEGLCPEEFERAMELVQDGKQINLMKWFLAFEQLVQENDMSTEEKRENFIMGYNSKCAAERLIAKMMYPI